MNDGLIYRTDGIVCPNKGKSSAQYVPIGDEFTAITNRNIVELHKATDVPKRLLSNAMGVKTDIAYISSTTGSIIVMNLKRKIIWGHMHITKCVLEY